VNGAADADVVGRACVPADPDPGPGLVGLGQQGDVGYEGAQQALAVLVAGGRIIPEPWQVGGELLQLGPAGQRRQGLRGCRQRLLGVGEPGLYRAWCRLVASSAADRASAICSAVSASSSTPAIAPSTVAAITDRQDGVVSRSARDGHS
jgi:hypothetical protein